MNEQTRDATHTNDAGERARGCDRAHELVAHLYGEATPEEDAAFARHLHACAVCRDELAAFSSVRELVSAERARTLAAAPALDLDELFTRQPRGADASLPLLSPPARARSAAAAFREFFALSPPWLRAGAVACAVLFCALAALTLARAEVRWDAGGFAFRTGGGDDTARERVVEKRVEVPVPTGFTREQLDALVAERLKEEREASNRDSLQARENAVEASSTETNVKRKSAPRLLAAGDARRTQQRRRAAPANARRDERQLAEDDLPRLSDLLGGAY